jgi:hypothetical protein
MNYIVILLIFECLQYLDGESPDQANGDSLEVVVFDELVQVNAQQLKPNDQVLSEYRVVLHSDDIVHIIWIILLQIH